MLPLSVIGFKINQENKVQFTIPFNFADTIEFMRNFNLSVRLNNNVGYYHCRRNEPNSNDNIIYSLLHRKLNLAARYYANRRALSTP
jgi:hypothetical protein